MGDKVETRLRKVEKRMERKKMEERRKNIIIKGMKI